MRFLRFNGRAVALGIALALMVASPLLQRASFAQASTAAGAIQGTVTDPKGAVVGGATVVITNLGTNSSKVLTTDSAGLYSASSLSPADYRVEVSAPGFAKTATKLTIQIGTSTNGDLKLKLGNASEVVEVSANALQVNTVQSTVQGVLTETQIDQLPISGRNFLDLAQLEPGVQLQSGETFDPTKAGYSSISINGVNGRTARILLDGQDISDETVGTTTLNVSQGSIEEFQISRSSLDISNELTSSGAVTVSTRSGTNQYHGQLFGLIRDQNYGDAAAQDGSTNYFQREQFGARVGGAIIKDKLFFFGSSERTKQDSVVSVQQAAVFSAYNAGYTAPFRDTYSVGKLDYNAPKGVHLFFRGNYENNLDDATYGYGFSRYGNKDNTPAFAGGGDFTIGRLTNSLRVSYLKFHNGIVDQSAGLQILVPGIELFNNTFISGPNLLAPQQTYQSDKQIRYDAGYTIKSHVLNFGGSVNRILGGGFASFFGFAPEVSANFDGGPVGALSAGNPANYAAGYVVMGNGEGYNTEKSAFNQPAGGQGDYRLGLYFGDTWKVSQRLTVNYGIRYSRDTGRSDSDLAPIPCSAAVASWGAASPCTSGNLLDSINPAQYPGLGAQVRQPNQNFGPKAGFAYDLKGDGKTVIRGGLGLYFENNIFNNVLFDRPTRLASGLFFGDAFLGSGAASLTLPGGTSVSTIQGVPIASLWAMPISQSGPYFAALQALYQQTTIAQGAAANGSFVANSLSEGPNGDSMYAPNFRTTRSIQINIGVEHEFWKGGVFAADYIRNVGEHFQQALDVNHVGDARYLNTAAAQNAISSTLAACGVATIDQAIVSCAANPGNAGATIANFAGAGLDSGNAMLSGAPAAAFGLTPNTGAAFAGVNPNWGHMAFNFPLGRSLYNGLQTSFRQTARIPLQGLKSSNFQVSWTLGRFISSGGADQNFTPTVYDNNNPLGFSGPAGTDRKSLLAYGGTFGWAGGFVTSIIGHWNSALPSTLTLLAPNGTTAAGEIFSSDVTGDGTTQDILPGYKAGAFMRSVKPSDLASVIANYNATGAGRLTPAGQAVVSAGLMTQTQLTELGAVTRTVAAPPSGNVGNGALRTLDLELGRPIKFKQLGERFSLDPTVSFFNLFNFANFSGTVETGALGTIQTPASVNGTDGSLNGRNFLRNGNGSGVFGVGTARVIEYGLKINF
jgi:hypothetical protein